MPDPPQDTANDDYPIVCGVCGERSAYPARVATDGPNHLAVDLCCHACGAAWTERREARSSFQPPLDK